MTVTLGLDLGTSALKGLIIGEHQAVLAEAEAPLSLSRPQPGWGEQQPEDWWQATLTVAAALKAHNPAAWADVAAIGLSGQMHGAVLLDRRGSAVRPAILWTDARAAAEAEELNRMLPQIGAIAGVPAMASFVAPKLLWLARHEPETFAAFATLLLPKDYLRFKLTGNYATDMCDAAGSLLLDERSRTWSPAILESLRLDPGKLPRLYEGSEITGQLTASAAELLGLKCGLPVAAGAGDAAAGAIGLGAVNDGDAIISLGTSSQYFITTASYRPAPADLIHAFAHGLSDRWFQMAALLNGASVLTWVAGVLGRNDIGELLREAEAAFAGPSNLLFLPYLMGERTPHNDPQARGMLYGLSPATSATEIVQAVLEGVALSLADAQACLRHAGSDPAAISVTGGGSRSAFWMRLLAAILDKPLQIRDGAEKGPAFGAARLARMALTGETAAQVCTPAPLRFTIAPDPTLAAAYAGRLTRFRAAYQALKPVMRDGV